MEKYILALDHGTTSSRAILFNKHAKPIAMAQIETGLEYPFEGAVLLDALEIWLAVQKVIVQVIEKAEISPEQIAGIGLCNQRETTVLWDKRNGIPIYKAIVWQSRQSEQICEEWKQKGYEKIIHEITGLRIDPYFSASKICWIFDHVPKARKLAEEGNLLFGTMDSFLLWKLSGGKVHMTDLSNASRTLLCDIHTGTWSKELLKLFDIPENILPVIESNSQVYCETSPEIFYNQKIPVCSMIGDQQAALFGQLCLKKGQVKNTYGTGGFVLMNTGNEIVDSKYGLLSTVAWKLNNEITYALEGSVFVSGSVMKWLRDELDFIQGADVSEKQAMEVKDHSGVYIVPAFVGLGTPYWNEQARACIMGLSFSTSRKHMVKAALESMAFQVKDVLDCMEKDSGINIEYLKVDGGAAVNNYLLQFQADLIEKEVIRYTVHELSALGAAFLAGLAIDYYQLDQLKLEPDRIFVPEKDSAWVRREYGNWKRAVQACEIFSGRSFDDLFTG